MLVPKLPIDSPGNDVKVLRYLFEQTSVGDRPAKANYLVKKLKLLDNVAYLANKLGSQVRVWHYSYETCCIQTYTAMPMSLLWSCTPDQYSKMCIYGVMAWKIHFTLFFKTGYQKGTSWILWISWWRPEKNISKDWIKNVRLIFNICSINFPTINWHQMFNYLSY